MTIFPHAIVGAASASITNNYFLAFLLGFISHFILDMLPHLEPKSLVTKEKDGTKKWSPWLFVFILVEFTITVLFFYYLRHRSNFNILLVGAFGGLLPDIIANNPFLQGLRHKPVIKHFFTFHDKIHLDLPDKFWYLSFIVEALVIGGTIWYFLR